ncbi:hypothetical protein [Glutamicibacter ardleyensis]|uniref:Terminase small subunit n=1 Tax=Glutamicibacter ardleyensis TaxID=225894 RepID=A0ABQ2DV43_9MICC|nr:hypothetical protein [Glutamicibacter ardleyensis]GGJ74444.1 hypothetical protein GCM10007173_36770 [Glutamicibacter ardleyensis]
MEDAEIPQIPYRHGGVGPGLGGYRKGCRCAGCKKSKRDDMAAYRARRKLREQGGEVALDELPELPPAIDPSSMSLDWQAEPGQIEEVLTEELGKLVGEPPFKKTLLVLAKYNARVLDQIPRIERPDLISGMESRLFNVFDRLRKVTDGAGGQVVTPEEFLAGLLSDDPAGPEPSAQ